MTNIIKFPAKKTQSVGSVQDKSTKHFTVIAKSVFNGVIHFVWVATVLTWPIFKWVLSLDILFQLLQMIYH